MDTIHPHDPSHSTHISSEERKKRFILWFSELGIEDVPLVGGKNASLGEMFSNLTAKGVRVPDGFAISAWAYDYFISTTGLREQIVAQLQGLDAKNIEALGRCGKSIRDRINATPLPKELEQEIIQAYDRLAQKEGTFDTAVRSSATAEDLPDASFAGQQDSYLNIHGHAMLLIACRSCFASLFTDRAIAYRQEKKFDHFSISLSIAVQKMARSDLASAGVMFSLDTESGFRDAIYITGGYGLGENVVQGAINPDEWYVHKPKLLQGHEPIIYSMVGAKQQRMVYQEGAPENTLHSSTRNDPVPQEERDQFCLNEQEVLELARWAAEIETHYKRPMDIEWAKDGKTGLLYIVQARPETVVSQGKEGVIRRTTLERSGPVLAEGLAVGNHIGHGRAAVIRSAENITQFQDGMVLVTEVTDPDWVPIMHKASAIVTDLGGRTSHAAIVSRELGIPCVVGAGDASKRIQPGQEITVSCAGGSKGIIYEGLLPYREEEVRLAELSIPNLPLFFHHSEPSRSFLDAQYPAKGVGLLRIDELLREEVKVHPMACVQYPGIEDREAVDAASLGYQDKQEYFVTRLSQGIAQIAAAMHPRPVCVLLSDGTSADLAALAGGKAFRFPDANPLLGTRGVGRYTDLDYEEAFALELRAIQRVREKMGLENLALILPAVHSAKEIAQLHQALAQNQLGRGTAGLRVHMLCRTPAQLLQLKEYDAHVDGFVFHTMDLAQLALGIDASNPLMRPYFDSKHPAVLQLLEQGLNQARALGKPALLAHMPPADLPFFSHWPLRSLAGGFVVRAELFERARVELLDGEGRAA